MILIKPCNLPAESLQQLAEYQAEINSIQSFAEKVAAAKREFSQRNRKDNAAFRDVRLTLDVMCAGSRRCMYCEDSCADEVEHIHPKNFYPELVFVWDNYLYACGPCNGHKRDKFAVFDSTTQEMKLLSDDVIAPPPLGNPLLINPREEDALKYLILDVWGTFAIQPAPNLSPQDTERAKFTIEVLDLNRDILLEARHAVYESYRALLGEYTDEKVAKKDLKNLTRLREAICNQPHPTVWHEMRRHHQKIAELKPLFEIAPEALEW